MEVDSTDAGEYMQGWRELNTMIRRGGSLSGRERNCAFLNIGNENSGNGASGPQFACVSAVAGFDFEDDGRAMALVDWDFDGDLDLWAGNRTGPRLRLLENGTRNVSADDDDAQHIDAQYIDDGHFDDGHFVALRLQGTACNRDAIGARVEVTVESASDSSIGGKADRTLVRSVSAGDSYLTQSTRWLHFGLGRAEQIRNVRIIWPVGRRVSGSKTADANVQEIGGLQVDRRYLIVQGEPVAKPFDVAPLSLADLPEPSRPRAKPLPQRILISRRVPFPPLEVKTPDGSKQPLYAKPGRPLLVNFWAAWCGPCLKELAQWSQRRDEIEAAGLDVIALSAQSPNEPDGNGTDVAAQSQAAVTQSQAAIARLKFPFPWALIEPADVKLADTVLTGVNPEYQRPFGVPVSILLDRHGQAMAIYRGAVELDVVLRDAALAEATPEQLRVGAAPFGGQWLNRPLRAKVLDYASTLKEADLRVTPAEYLRHVLALGEQDVPGPCAISDRMLGDAAFALGSDLLSAGRLDESIKYSRRASKYLPRDYRPHANWGAALLRLGLARQALKQFDIALERSPQRASVLFNRGNALSQLERHAEAIADWETAAARRPDDDKILARLAAVSFGLGDDARAARHYRELLRLDSGSIDYRAALAWILATSADAEVRDGAEAVRLAAAWVEAADPSDPKPLNALAAALAEDRQFDKAVAVMERAIDLARQQNNGAMLRSYEARLNLYEQGKPFRRR